MATTLARGAIQWDFEAIEIPASEGLTPDALARGVERVLMYDGFTANASTFNVAWASGINTVIQGPMP